MLRKSLFFIVIALTCLSAHGHEVNFQQLENCYNWTNLALRSSEMKTFRSSQFLGNVSHGTSANADINALVVRLSDPNRVAVIQNNGGTVYPVSRQNQIRSACSRNQNNGGMVLPVSGSLNAGEESANLNPTYIRVQVYEHRGRQTGTELCHINSANAALTPTGVQGQSMDDSQIEATVRQAILERLQWVSANATPQNSRNTLSIFNHALENGGACFQVLPMFTGLDGARTAALCAVNPNPGPECQPAPPTSQSGEEPEARP